MKLELKYLSPYLPYGLRAQDLRTKEVRTVTLLHFTYDNETVGHNHLIYDGLMLSKHFPILRPLSDLTKEIEHNGEKFVPIEVLRKDYLGFWFEYNVELLIKSKNTHMYISIDWMSEINNKLLEWHFDIFGLIKKNLAIDINTLN